MQLNEQSIYRWVQVWVRDNKEDIVRSYCREPQWPQWLEAELARHLQSLPGRRSIDVEPHFYLNGAQGRDVKLIGLEGTVITVELKHEALFVPKGTTARRRGDLSYPLVRADVRRLRWRRSAADRAMAILLAICSEAQASIQSLVPAYSIDKKTFNAMDDWVVATYRY